MENSTNELALILPASVRVLMPNGQVEEMKLETYLAGSVAAEIGTTAPLEALKAQAVASRTYVVSAERHHEQNADVCITGHCQKWKRVDPVTAPEVFRALSETWGMVAVHNGKLIDAFFFEHCDGHTRNAEEMLIPAADYLRGVDCSCGHLNLKGHGVGMCKRGAIVMARRNAAFVQILRHYYRGIVVMRMKAEKPAAPDLAETKPVHAPEAPKKPRVRKIMREPPPVSVKPSKPIVREPDKPRPTTRPEVMFPSIAPSGRALLKKMSLPFRRKLGEAKPGSIEPSRVEPEPPQPIEETPPITEPVQTHVTTPMQSTVEVAPAPGIAEPALPTIEQTLPIAEPVQTDAIAPMQSTVEVVPAPSVVEPASLIIEEATTSPQSQMETPAPVVAEPKVETPPLVSPVPEHELPPLEGIEIKPARRMHVDHLPGSRMIAGCLARAGIVVSIQNGNGHQMLVFSGSAPHYGEGGFETVVDEDGTYHVTIEGETLEVHVRGETVFIHAA